MAGLFVQDTFSGGVSGDPLTGHVGETGASWARDASSNVGADAYLTDAGRVRRFSGSSGTALLYASGVPPSREYRVAVDLVLLSDDNGSANGPAGRIVPSGGGSAESLYFARWNANGNTIQLYKGVNGAYTQLGSWAYALPLATAVTCALDLTDAAKIVTMNGVEVGRSTDNAVTAVGRAGLRFFHSGGGNNDTSGLHLDNFTATDLSAPTGTTQQGTTGSSQGQVAVAAASRTQPGTTAASQTQLATTTATASRTQPGTTAASQTQLATTTAASRQQAAASGTQGQQATSTSQAATATPFVQDTFSGGASGDLLTGHVGEVGASWSKHPSSNSVSDAYLTDAGRVRQVNSNIIVLVASGAPPSAEYEVTVGLYFVNSTGVGAHGPAGRIDPTAPTLYFTRWISSMIQLYKRVNGTYTQLGAWADALSVGTEQACTLRITDAAKIVTVDGVELGRSTDNAITAAGRAGLFFSNGHNTDATGLHVDNFIATGLSAPTGTTHLGTAGSSQGQTATATALLTRQGTATGTQGQQAQVSASRRQPGAAGAAQPQQAQASASWRLPAAAAASQGMSALTSATLRRVGHAGAVQEQLAGSAGLQQMMGQASASQGQVATILTVPSGMAVLRLRLRAAPHDRLALRAAPHRLALRAAPHDRVRLNGAVRR